MQAKQMVKTLFLSAIFFITSSFSIQANCCNIARGVTIGGYWDLDPKYYPKSVAYFENLRQKYPALHNIPIILWNGPCADHDTIYFSIKWIEKLEKGNKFYLDATEWILLHEAGHIHHYDILKSAIPMYGMIGSFLILYNANSIQNAYNLSNKTTDHLCYGSLACYYASFAGLIYLLSTREYQADDFAMQHCDNPQAWIAAYEFLDRFAPLGWLPGIFHSFTKYRLNRISKAFQEKFGYELVVVPQSLNPEFVD